ncbi:hypothetical protein J6590_033866 [Homalodisca vitripennis]|nr:hypothetical protein J6590_033866 [Homalodisca vitripennis]
MDNPHEAYKGQYRMNLHDISGKKEGFRRHKEPHKGSFFASVLHSNESPRAATFARGDPCPSLIRFVVEIRSERRIWKEEELPIPSYFRVAAKEIRRHYIKGKCIDTTATSRITFNYPFHN